MIEEWPCKHQKPEWRLITEGAVGDHRPERGVNERDPHGLGLTSVHEEHGGTTLGT